MVHNIYGIFQQSVHANCTIFDHSIVYNSILNFGTTTREVVLI